MAKIEWILSTWETHLAYADDLLEVFGQAAMMDYLRLVEEALNQLKKYPEAGSPTISIVSGRRVQLTSSKQYQIHYDYDKVNDKIIVVAIFK